MSKNRLATETSPYLLQHKDNPVHWYSWGQDAFEAARRGDKPILLSIGYAACHWCHVMAHESFEDQATADVMNAHFINVKVDREERPEVDKIYMDAIHALGEQGGWPLNVFLAPDGTPFWGGTYFPSDNRYGRPGFRHVLTEIARIWRDERDKVAANCQAIVQALSPADPPKKATLSSTVLSRSADVILDAIDNANGGLKGAPKFPQCAILDLLWRHHLRTGDARAGQAVTLSLTMMCQGGIYDHLAGGFARYTVDDRWLVPHFEKMLYDNAQIVRLLAYAMPGNERLFRTRLEETVAWLLTDMLIEDGGFASSYDADSEGEEGKYYVWSEQDIDRLLPAPDAALFKSVYDVSSVGNWEDSNILNRLHAPELGEEATERRLRGMRQVLLTERRSRVPPGFDDKVLADWNGLVIEALATSGLITGQAGWVEAAKASFAAVLGRLWNDGVLHHSYRAGQVRNLATADGYANLIAAAIALYQATADARYISRAVELETAMTGEFWSEPAGAFHFAAASSANLIVRTLYGHDDATPNANATMLSNYPRLAFLTGDDAYLARADRIHDAFAAKAIGNSFAFAGMLAAFDDRIGLVQLVLTGDPGHPDHDPLRQAIPAALTPATCIRYAHALSDLPAGHPLAGTGKTSRPAIHICKGQTCSLPVYHPEELPSAIEALTRPTG